VEKLLLAAGRDQWDLDHALNSQKVQKSNPISLVQFHTVKLYLKSLISHMKRNDFWIFLIAVALVLTANILYGIYIVPFLWQSETKVVVFLNYILAVLTLYTQIQTHLLDPGV
jgi:uncharacterized membrane protein